MQPANNLCYRKPGPRAIFTQQLNLKVRPDQVESLEHIAQFIDRSVSEVVRWVIDEAVDAWDTTRKEKGIDIQGKPASRQDAE